MKTFLLGAGLLAGALAVAAWTWRGDAVVHDLARASGLSHDAAPSTGAALAAAGVHKCQSASGIAYLDRPCPRGSRELAADGGAVTVISLPRPAPRPGEAASGVLGGPLVEGFGQEEADRLRDRQVEAAANR
jgi:hypothetical protein